MQRMLGPLGCLAALLAAGCPPTAGEGDAAPDAAIAIDAALPADGGGDAASDGAAADGNRDAHAGSDRTADAGPPALVWCDAGTACNSWPGADGGCPGQCIAQRHELTCRGTVDLGVCRQLPADRSNPPLVTAELRIATTLAPALAHVGESHRVEVTVTELTGAPQSLSFTPRHPDSWQLNSSNFDAMTTLELAANETRTLSAQLTALQPDVLQVYGGSVVGFAIGPVGYEVYSAIVFDDQQPIACGGFFFPASYCGEPTCSELGTFYASARCCGDVFFAGGYCCADRDCGQGICSDGKCLSDVPAGGGANSLPIGNQRIGLILVDSHPISSGTICDDRSTLLASELQLDLVEAWFDAAALARTGRDLLSVGWYVMAGLDTADFLIGGDHHFPNYAAQLDAHLTQQGCLTLADFDKVIVASPQLDLGGLGGVAADQGRIAVVDASNPLLLAHELAHTYGASDLYLDLGGPLVYLFDLMGNNLGGFGQPADAVTWNEIGLGDVDGNRVIDAMEFAAFPEALAIRSLRALITGRPTLEIQIALGALEDGVVRRVVIDRLRIDLPEYGVGRDLLQPGTQKTLALDGSEVPIETIRGAGQLEVRVRASLRFTDRSWTQRQLDLDQTQPVTVEP